MLRKPISSAKFYDGFPWTRRNILAEVPKTEKEKREFSYTKVE